MVFGLVMDNIALGIPVGIGAGVAAVLILNDIRAKQDGASP